MTAVHAKLHVLPQLISLFFFFLLNLALQAMLLFLVILLVGAGYGFVKKVLTANEKKLFALVLTLQVLANTATIVIDETSEGSRSHAMWQSINLLVDLICCAAIIFPIMWSIKVRRSLWVG